MRLDAMKTTGYRAAARRVLSIEIDASGKPGNTRAVPGFLPQAIVHGFDGARVELGFTVVGEQAVYFLFDVGQLRVA
jgi:hypothetical protein